ASASAFAKAPAVTVNFMTKPPGSQPSPHARIKWFEGPSSSNSSACSMKRIVMVPGPWEHPSSPPLGSDDVSVATFADDVEAALVDGADCSHPQRPRAVRTERAGGEGNAVAILSPLGECGCQRLARLRVHFRVGFDQGPRATIFPQQARQTVSRATEG